MWKIGIETSLSVRPYNCNWKALCFRYESQGMDGKFELRLNTVHSLGIL